MAAPQITDRAKRYRAQKNVRGPRKCVLCGSRSDLGVMHLSGSEDDGERANLAYGCRSCNGKLSAAFKRIGAGRPTNQYNPAAGGIPTYEQYKWGVTHHNRGEHDEGGAIIHATPKHKRIQYAKMIAREAGPARRETAAQRRRDFDERWNSGTRDNLFGFGRKDARRTTPATGGIAYHSARTGKSGGGRSTGGAAGSHKGYKIGRTADGEYFSSLDPDSLFETKRGATALIDSYLKGRTNPTWDGRPITAAERERAYAEEDRERAAAEAHAEKVRAHAQKEYERRRAGRGNPSKFDRCVKKVKAKGGAGNAYAVCTAAGTRNPSKRKRWGENIVLYSGPDAEQAHDYLRRAIAGGGYIGLQKFKSKGEWYVTADSVRGGEGRRNPADASAKVFEEFHGYAPGEVVTVTKKVFYHAHLAAAGKLTFLQVWGVDGQGHTIKGFKGTLLAFNEDKNQLFAEGGDQEIDLRDYGIKAPHELETLGQIVDIGYFGKKTHLGKEGGEAVYVHKFRSTNQNGRHVVVKYTRYPDLIYDVRNAQLLFSGGSYEILAEGINK